MLTGLAVALAFKAGLFNIGAQGQFIVGAIGASYVGFTFELPIVLHTLAAIAAAIVCAGLYGGFVGLLKARTGAHEVIVTIMLNYVASYFLLWLLSTKAFLREGRMDPIAPEVLESSRLPRLAGQDFRLHSGIFIALLAALAIWWLLNRSTLGFKFRAVGANAKASRTAGISVAKSTTFVMVIAGSLAGLGGAVHILGADHALTNEVGGSFGFDAITVALLGRATPLGTVLAALLFGALRAGGLTMQATTETPLDIVLIIQALVVLFIAAPAVIKAIFRLKKRRRRPSNRFEGMERLMSSFNPKNMSAPERRKFRGLITMLVLSIFALVAFAYLPKEGAPVTYGFVLGGEWVLLKEWIIDSKVASTLFAILALLTTFFAIFPLQDKAKFTNCQLYLWRYVLDVLSLMGGLWKIRTLHRSAARGASALSPTDFWSDGWRDFRAFRRVINIAIEGQLLAGAFVSGVLASLFANNWVGLFFAPFAGALIALLLAVFAIKYGIDQVILGFRPERSGNWPNQLLL
jgi:general nucleoside transport system permease protein